MVGWLPLEKTSYINSFNTNPSCVWPSVVPVSLPDHAPLQQKSMSPHPLQRGNERYKQSQPCSNGISFFLLTRANPCSSWFSAFNVEIWRKHIVLFTPPLHLQMGDAESPWSPRKIGLQPSPSHRSNSRSPWSPSTRGCLSLDLRF